MAIAHVGVGGSVYLLPELAKANMYVVLPGPIGASGDTQPVGVFLSRRYAQQCVCGLENVTEASISLS